MMKSAFMTMSCALLLTAATAQAQYDSSRCDEYGCDLNQPSGRAWRQMLAADSRRYNWQLSRVDGAGCRYGLCDLNGRCRNDDCRCEDGRCCVDGRCGIDGCRCDNGNCKDGRCDLGSRNGYGPRDTFPYADERGTRSRRLEDPFRPADYRIPSRSDYGRPDPRPIPTRYEPVRYESRRPDYRSIHWNSSIRRAVDQAARENRPILVQVTAPWCPHCERMKEVTWRDPEVVNLINERYVAIEVNADEQREFVQKMGIQSLPTTLIVNPDLQVLDRRQGFQSADQMLRALSR